MAKLTATELQELFDIVADIKTSRLNFCLSAAERTLRKLLTDAVYEASSPAGQIEALKFAEAHLAVYHLLLNTGLRIRRSGLIKKEQSGGSSVTNNTPNEFYAPEEISQLRQDFYEAALEAVKSYQPREASNPKNNSVLITGGWA